MNCMQLSSNNGSRKNLPYISLNIPGRIRFKFPQLYKNSSLAHRLKEFLINSEGITRVEVNIYSKSCLVLYRRGQLSPESLTKAILNFLNNYQKAVQETEDSHQKTATTTEGAAAKKESIESLKKKSHSSYKDDGKDFPWHQLPISQITNLLRTNTRKGLTREQARSILQKYGPNQFEEKKKESIFSLLLSQFDDFLVKLLLGASGVSLFLGNIGDALAILVIVLVEAIIGVWQNYKAEKSLQALKEYSAAEAKVIRDGQLQKIPSHQLVQGDIIALETGDMVPADARLLESSNLEINEASLTGESEPVTKSHKINYSGPVSLPERKNMVYLGSAVTRGSGKAVIVETGMNTQMGQIARMIDDSEEELTPLQKDLDKMARLISFGCIGICGAITISGLLGGQPFLQMLRTGVSLAIGAIPEGLTTILAISLAFGVQRMARKGAIVKHLPSVETLSCADVICTDKTGTLTTGKLTVTEIHTISDDYQITGEGYSTEGDFLDDKKKIQPLENENLKQLITTGSLCNNSSHNETDSPGIGDPSEIALRILASKANLTVKDFNCYTREKEISFDSETKKMTVVCQGPEDKYSVHTKGAPDIILPKCTKILDNGKVREMTDEDKDKIYSKINKMAENTLRVMGFAYKELDKKPVDDDQIEEELVFIGLTGMFDPPRQEVRGAIKKCHKAGIRVIMITGDHKKTAEAIGQDIGLLDKDSQIVSGNELDNLSDEELKDRIDQIAIFARTSPHQKLRIVKALKKKGHTVVMTGDGVNDAPAIKDSHIGIAMGKNGTDVTREASSIILTDDNFTTIVNAIEEGRGISNNVKKFMRYVLSGNIGEVLAIFVGTLMGLPAALIPVQILMINLVTEGIPALALGLDPADEDAMEKNPRDANQSIFDGQLKKKILSRGIMMGLSTLGLFSSTYFLTGNLVKARTLAYANLITNQMFHVFDCRTNSISKNKYLVPSVAFSSLLLLGSIYIPGLRGVFGTSPLNLLDWTAILFFAGFTGRLDYIKEKAARLVSMGRNPQPATAAV